MKAVAFQSISTSQPMSKGTSAPPEMAMHIRPLSSLAHSGLFSMVMENSIGQILAKPSPAAITAGIAMPDCSRHENARAQNSQERRETKTVARTHDGKNRAAQKPADREQQKEERRAQFVGGLLVHAKSLQRGLEKTPMQDSAPT